MSKFLRLDWPLLQHPGYGLVWRSNGFWLGLFGLFLFISLPFFIERYMVAVLQKGLQESAINFTKNLENKLEIERMGFQRSVAASPEPKLHFDTLSARWIKGSSDVLAVHLLDQSGHVLKSALKPGNELFSATEYMVSWEAANRISMAHAVELKEATYSALDMFHTEGLVNLIVPYDAPASAVYVITLDTKQWLRDNADDTGHAMRIDIVPFRSDVRDDYDRYYTNSLAWEGKWSLKFQSKDPLFALMQVLRPIFFALTWLIAALFFLYWRNFRLRQKAELELQTKSQLLERQSRLSLLGEMSAQLAHEINQPLTSIANYAVAGKLQLQSSGSTAALESLLQDILDQSHRAAQVLVSVRAILQPTPLELNGIDVNDLIKKLEPSLRFLCTPHNVILSVLCPNCIPVKINAILFEQVIFNLVKNSVQSLVESDRPYKRISISSNMAGGRALIEHADNGPGIHPSHVPKIFESFFTTKTEGLGIGLSLCRSIIERFNGRLTLKSNNQRGACFLIDIPTSPTPNHISSA